MCGPQHFCESGRAAGKEIAAQGAAPVGRRRRHCSDAANARRRGSSEHLNREHWLQINVVGNRVKREADMEKFVLVWLLGVPLLMLVVLQYFV